MKRPRILLAHLGARDISQHNVTPPVGLLCLAAYVRERFDADLRVVDQRVEGWSTEDVAREAAAFEADIVGFSCATPSAYLLPDAVQSTRRGLPDALIVLGGPHASAFGAEILEDVDADVVVVGEGERTFERVLEVHLGGGDFGAIPSLVWRDPDGGAVTNPGATPFIEDLDSLPMPAYDLIDVSRYWSLASFVLVPRRRYVSLITSRGCPYQCNYCHNLFGKRFRGHSPERIVSEIEHFMNAYGINDVEFLDDVFNYDHDRAIEVCDLIRKKDLGVRLALPNGVRTDTLSEELIEALDEAGLYFCSFALESGSPRIQKLMGKRLHVPSFIENVALAADRGIFSNGFAMLGFPTESEEELKQTIEIMCASKLHTGQFHTVTPFPGSKLFEELRRTQPELAAAIDFKDRSVFTIRVNLADVPDEVLFAHQRRANLRFYLNASRIVRIFRHHPAPRLIPYYLPMFLERVTKGILARS